MFNIGPAELVIVLVIALFVAGIAIAVLKLLAGPSRSATPPDPRSVLADRLARGEITKEEFDTAMRALGYPAPG